MKSVTITRGETAAGVVERDAKGEIQRMELVDLEAPTSRGVTSPAETSGDAAKTGLSSETKRAPGIPSESKWLATRWGNESVVIAQTEPPKDEPILDPSERIGDPSLDKLAAEEKLRNRRIVTMTDDAKDTTTPKTIVVPPVTPVKGVKFIYDFFRFILPFKKAADQAEKDRERLKQEYPDPPRPPPPPPQNPKDALP
jgi:hypothetical protein